MSKPSPDLKSELAALDEIFAWFENDDFDIDQAIAKFEEGSALAERVKEKLATLENKITVLKEKFDAEA